MKKTAIVTGASSGIGREISRVLVEMGYEVYGFGREFPEEESEQIRTKQDPAEMIGTENGTDKQNQENGMLRKRDSAAFHAAFLMRCVSMESVL